MTEILALFVGVFLGGFVMSLLSVNSYDRGAKDEREKLWHTVYGGRVFRPAAPPEDGGTSGPILDNDRRDAPDH